MIAALLLLAQAARGIALLESGHILDAAASLEATVEKDPRDAPATTALARALLAEREFDRAEGQARRAVELQPQSSHAHFILGVVLAEKIDTVSIFSKLSMAKEMRAEFERALALDSRSVEAREALCQYFLQAPGIAGGSVDEARKQAAEVTRLDPVRGELLRAEIAQHEEQDPAPLFEAALEGARTADQRVQVLQAQAAWLRRQQKGAAASRKLREATQEMPGNALLQAVLSDALFSAGDVAGAAQAARNSLQLDPGLPVGQFMLAQALETQGRKAEAKVAYQQYLRRSPPRVKQAEVARSRLERL